MLSNVPEWVITQDEINITLLFLSPNILLDPAQELVDLPLPPVPQVSWKFGNC